MRVVYALTTQGRDLYSETARVSIASVRASNPTCEIVVVCDRQSAGALQLSRNPILQEIDKLRCLDTPPGSNVFRNRYIKTSLRDIVDGAFLYLDAGTFVQGDLSPIFRMGGDVACAPNNSNSQLSGQRWRDDDDVLSRLGWRGRDDFYANGGVIFFNETNAARRFSEVWQAKYRESCQATGVFRDQPSLNVALSDPDLMVSILPHRYNAQFRFAPEVAANAIILHFYSSGPSFTTTNYDKAVAGLISGRPLRSCRISSMIHKKSAAKRGVFMEGTALRKIAGELRGWYSAIFTRERSLQR